jgi:hypothetical protein
LYKISSVVCHYHYLPRKISQSLGRKDTGI